MNTDQNPAHYLSKEKLAELTKELEELRTNKRKEVAEELEYAKGLGDLSENAEYQDAREAQANLEARIIEIENILKNSVVIKDRHTDSVGIGSTVHVLKEGDKTKITFMVTGTEEADLAAGKLSNQSPLGKAILGKKKGDTVVVNAPKGKVTYKIEGIE